MEKRESCQILWSQKHINIGTIGNNQMFSCRALALQMVQNN